ncbi:unnamed protein product [Anisakis simplex]|uniref:Uncharacterized protein n=1 Tax=Anisakis simplex TaxID=6269 RepID=A0A0M3KAS4_ANISI|nr:unnamed protein product [Anisakis simplex]
MFRTITCENDMARSDTSVEQFITSGENAHSTCRRGNVYDDEATSSTSICNTSSSNDESPSRSVSNCNFSNAIATLQSKGNH